MYTREKELLTKIESGEQIGILRPLTGLRYTPDHKNLLEVLIAEDLEYGYKDNQGNEIKVFSSPINKKKEVYFNEEKMTDVLGEAATNEENLGLFFSVNEKQGYVINDRYFAKKEIGLGEFIVSPEGKIERVEECQRIWYNQTEIEEIRILYGEITKTVNLELKSL